MTTAPGLLERAVRWSEGGQGYEGHLVRPAGTRGPLPAVLVAHAWRGRDGFAVEAARRMARLGWVGFASDAYGEGRTASTDEEAGKLMGAALADPAALRRRLAAALAAMAREDGVDPTRLAAIGFCFGGLCALELARSGADLRGAVSFHGFLRPPDPALPSRPRARLLVLHGSADPLVPWDQMDAFRTEMTSAGADWEAIAYGGAAHGFTNPSAASPERGIVHHSEVARRAWARAQTFLADAFAG